jgi:DNA mismatch repair protein MSH6
MKPLQKVFNNFIGKIELFQGYDQEYDLAKERVEAVEKNLETYREECSRQIGAKIVYKDIGKEVYQLEVAGKKSVPRDWTVMSKTKDVNRYYTPKLRNLVTELLQMKEYCEMALRDIKTRVFQRFDELYENWFNNFIVGSLLLMLLVSLIVF